MYSPLCADAAVAFCADDDAADTMSFCPIRMLLLVSLFHDFNCATVHPCLSAIFPRTSPLFTMYVVALAGADVPVAAVAFDDDEEM